MLFYVHKLVSPSVQLDQQRLLQTLSHAPDGTKQDSHLLCLPCVQVGCAFLVLQPRRYVLQLF